MRIQSLCGWAAGALLTLSAAMTPVHALANETALVQSENSLKEVLSDVYGMTLENVRYRSTEKDTLYYANDQFDIEVKGLDLTATGEQKIQVTYRWKKSDAVNPSFTLTTSVRIEDTQAPVIEAQESYEIVAGDDFDLTKEVKASDLQDDNVTIETEGDFDPTKAGEYDVTVVARDTSGNESRKAVRVTVKENTGFYDAIAQAALAQLGVNQDCTMLVTNSLKAVGIDFHGSPEAYLSLGELTDTPVPGDICVYQGHVAVYIGNGQAVHGGWNGYTTAIYSVQCANPFIGYVHVNIPA